MTMAQSVAGMFGVACCDGGSSERSGADRLRVMIDRAVGRLTRNSRYVGRALTGAARLV